MDDLLTIIAAATKVEPPQDDKATQWVEILPGPEIKFRDGRKTLTMTDAHKVIEACDLERGVLVDLDHQSENLAKNTASEAPAAGWIVAMAAKNGGIHALIEWTKLGRERLKDRQYRYISPTIRATKDGQVFDITSAGLTNTPALTMKALAAEEREPVTDPKDKAKPTAFWSELTAALGLADTATKAEIMAQIVTLKDATGRAKNDLDPVERDGDDTTKTTASLDTLAAHIDTVNRERNDERMELVITQASRDGRLPPAMHGWARELGAANPELLDQFVSSISPVTNFDALDPAKFTTLTAAATTTARSDVETTLCTQLGVTPADLR